MSSVPKAVSYKTGQNLNTCARLKCWRCFVLKVLSKLFWGNWGVLNKKNDR